MNNEIKKFINNDVNFISKKYSLILGLSPSLGARSPKLWNELYKKMKIDCMMYPADITKKNLKNVVNVIKKDPNFVGAAVTMPYKEKIITYLDKIDLFAKKIGSINTIIKKNGKLIGYNTDYIASKNLITKFRYKKKILILGAGGVGKAVIIAVNEVFKNREIFIFNRNLNKIQNFKKNLKQKNLKTLKNYSSMLKLSEIDLIINTTSIGFDLWQKNKNGFYNLKFFNPLSSLKKLIEIKTKNKQKFLKINKNLIAENTSKCKFFLKNNKKIRVLDLIYQPLKTKLIELSKKEKYKTENGLQINKIQAIEAFMLANNITKRY